MLQLDQPGNKIVATPLTTAEFFKRTAIVIGLALVPVLIWFLFDVILIAVGAMLIAVLLRLVAEPFTRWAGLPQSLALILSGMVIVGVFGGTAYLFGTHIAAELKDVSSRADEAMTAITKSLQGSQLGKLVLSHVQGGNLSVPQILSSVFSVSTSFFEALVVMVIGGFYLAAQPRLYRTGLRQLFPAHYRRNAGETIDDIARGLRLWWIGELIQMALIGALSTAAVWLIGLPSPLALGVIAGVAEFVPYLGPVIAAVPALLVAATKDLNAVIWTAVAYLMIHQIEGNLIAPILQRHMVYIPPAVMLLGIVSILFAAGTVAMIFAAPIAVILFIAVKKIYVRDSLGEATELPGEPD